VQIYGNTFLVVGASGVLGGAITRLLTAKGARVLGTATSNESANRIPTEAAVRLLLDLENPASIRVLSDYLVQGENIQGVILAAGRVGFGLASETSHVDAARITRINYLGQAQLVAELKPLLTRSQPALVAAITGVVAEKSFPSMAAYCASKQALAGWLASVALEWRKDGVQFLEARPGHTETGLASRPMFGTAPAFPVGMSAEHVAQAIVAGIEADAKVLASSDF